MDLVIVTGMSGAGRNTAIKFLEDYGYFCVDNLPVSLIGKFAELALESPQPMNRIALGLDIRGGRMISEAAEILDRLPARCGGYRLLFMDAADECLLRRYKETRRTHPLSDELPSLEDAFTEERKLLTPLRSRAWQVIDTTFLRPQQLQNRIYELLIKNTARRSLHVTLMTFGYKYGIPEESDYVIDVRFLPNPFYDEKLREFSGLDEAVREYALNHESGRNFLTMLTELFRFLLSESARAGRNSVVIAIGCTGGRHRSVSVAWELSERLKNTEEFGISVFHRDMDKGRR